MASSTDSQPVAAAGDEVAEYIAARDAYEAATRKPTSHGSPVQLRHGDPIAIRYQRARAALSAAPAAPAPVDGDAVAKLAAKWDAQARASRRIANGLNNLSKFADGLDTARAELTAALAQDRAAQAGVPDLTDELDFEPDEDHTVADMANVGYSLMQAIKSNCPGYCWGESPAEIVVYLINQRDEATSASQAGAAGVPEGWRLVPENSTDEMHRAYTAAKYEGPKPTLISDLWAAMLAAAPTPAAEGEVRNV